MINGKKVYAIIPVRGGSKGIPGKNLYKLGNETILERAIRQAKSCSHIDQVIVSTDDPQMYEISKKHGVNAPGLRPDSLATSNAKTIDVIFHLLNELKIKDSYILLLQVTSPLRNNEDFENIFKLITENKADSVVSVTAHDDPHPYKIQKIENGYLKSFLGYESMVPRQELPKVYRLNGAFYLTDTNTLLSKKSFFTDKTMPYLMPEERSINLDTKMDLLLLKAIQAENLVLMD